MSEASVLSGTKGKKMTADEVLAIPMSENDASATNIKGYLKALLTELWSEGEGFSGKRPFGNSGWEYDFYVALVKSGAVEGKLDSDGCIKNVDKTKANELIFEAIEALN